MEFATSNEAKVAFRALAYKNFRGRPLLLEKAPVGIFQRAPKSKVEPVPPAISTTTTTTTTEEGELDLTKPGHSASPVDLSLDDSAAATLFVKNLSFTSKVESLRALFEDLPGYRSATISMKKDPKNPGNMLSMGFGFVEFQTMQLAKSAMDRLQVHTLVGGPSLL